MSCPVCEEIIWEDEWDMLNDTFIHERCRREYIKRTYHISEEQFQRLYGAKELRDEIDALRQTAIDYKEWMESRSDELEEKLKILIESGEKYTEAEAELERQESK